MITAVEVTFTNLRDGLAFLVVIVGLLGGNVRAVIGGPHLVPRVLPDRLI